MPVTMPGSASGRMTTNEIVSRPKNRWRETANAASVPSSSAISVAPVAAFTDVHSASRTPGLSIARPNQSSVSPGIGHFSVRRSLKAYRKMTAIGR